MSPHTPSHRETQVCERRPSRSRAQRAPGLAAIPRRPLAVAILLSLLACAPSARAGPGAVPEPPTVFAPGVISGNNVWKGSFAPDGQALYLFKQVPGGEENYRIYVSRQRGEHWTPPERVSLGEESSDLYPAISPDGLRLVFASYRPIPGESAAPPSATLWMVTWRGDGWGPPENLTRLSIPGRYHSQTGFDASGALYFRRSIPGQRYDLTYRAAWNGAEFDEAVPFNPVNRWITGWRGELHVWGGQPSPDGRLIVLEVSSLADGRPGPSDLWVSCSTVRGGWSEPRPLAESVNTPSNENFIFFAPDGRRLFFVRAFSEILSVSMHGLCQ